MVHTSIDAIYYSKVCSNGEDAQEELHCEPDEGDLVQHLVVTVIQLS